VTHESQYIALMTERERKKIISILGLKERIEKKEIKRNRMRGNYASEKQKKT